MSLFYFRREKGFGSISAFDLKTLLDEEASSLDPKYCWGFCLSNIKERLTVLLAEVPRKTFQETLKIFSDSSKDSSMEESSRPLKCELADLILEQNPALVASVIDNTLIYASSYGGGYKAKKFAERLIDLAPESITGEGFRPLLYMGLCEGSYKYAAEDNDIKFTLVQKILGRRPELIGSAVEHITGHVSLIGETPRNIEMVDRLLRDAPESISSEDLKYLLEAEKQDIFSKNLEYLLKYEKETNRSNARTKLINRICKLRPDLAIEHGLMDRVLLSDKSSSISIVKHLVP